jgi:hypothetical protein
MLPFTLYCLAYDNYVQSALSVDNFIPDEGFLEMLEESIDNLPIAIQYVAPGNSGDSKKRQSSSNGSKSTKTGSKRRKKSTDSLMDIPQNFTFTMYPSELEDLPCPGNKRYFALMKTVSLCRYAQAVNPLDVSHSFRGRSSFGQAGGNGEAVLHVNNAVSVAEAEALSHNIAMEDWIKRKMGDLQLVGLKRDLKLQKIKLQRRKAMVESKRRRSPSTHRRCWLLLVKLLLLPLDVPK